MNVKELMDELDKYPEREPLIFIHIIEKDDVDNTESSIPLKFVRISRLSISGICIELEES